MSDNLPQVLIAEDNPGLARVLSFKFKSSGFAPIVCADGQLAWEAYQANSVAAVISDQEMPRMSGTDLCRNIRAVDSDIPFFLVTGRQLELASTDIAKEMNINKVFGKPFSPSDVIAAVKEAMNGSRAACP